MKLAQPGHDRMSLQPLDKLGPESSSLENRVHEKRVQLSVAEIDRGFAG